MSLEDYGRQTRNPAFNVILVVALLAVYEAGLVLSGSLRRNAADTWLKETLGGLGPNGILAFHTAVFGAFVIAALHFWRRRRPLFRYLPPFFVEAALYAGLLSPLVIWLQQPFLARGGADGYFLDLGAGVYEELVFRWLMIRGSFFLLHLDPWRVFEFGTGARLRDYLRLLGPLVAIVVGSSLLFAAYHHVGPGGEAWSLSAVLFRSLAGLILAAIFFARGLAMAVYVHAFYDLLVHLVG
ncbi:MAG: CPBP family glutamic-type intramembrane protease [Planctomycetota bacterium]